MKKKRKYNINIEDKTKLFFIILFFIPKESKFKFNDYKNV